MIHWPPNTVRKQTSNCVFFPSLCIINHPSVVTELCWEHSEPLSSDSELCVHHLIPRFSSCLLLFLECAILRWMGGVLPFFTADSMYVSSLEWESHRQTYTNRSKSPGIRGTVTLKMSQGSMIKPGESSKSSPFSNSDVSPINLYRGGDRWGEIRPLWDFRESLVSHSSLKALHDRNSLCPEAL